MDEELFKYIRERIEPPTVREFREKTKSAMERYAAEHNRLQLYKELEGFDETFNHELLQNAMIDGLSVTFTPGSFAAHAIPFIEIMTEALKSLRTNIDSLKA